MKKLRSIRYSFAFILIVMAVVFTMIILFNNIYATRLLRNRVYDNTRNAVRLYADRLDTSLDSLDSWLFSTTGSNVDLQTLNTYDYDQTAWHLALYRLQQNYNAELLSNSAAAIFSYFPKEDYYMISNNGIRNAEAKQLISENLEEAAKSRSWILAASGNEYYLLRMMKNTGITSGAMIRLKDYLEMDQGAQLVMVLADGTVYPSADPSAALEIAPDPAGGYVIQSLLGENSFIVYYPLRHGGDFLAQVIPERDVTAQSRSLRIVVLVIGTVLFLSLLFLSFFLNRSVMRPLRTLQRGINDYKNGNMDVYVSTRNAPEEFAEVSDVFNEAVADIRDLRIDSYERKLQAQNLEIQYVKQQITPHFMINCLNTAYQLTETGRMELVREMLRALSNHLRYTLSSGQTVTLKDEISFVENYIEISEIRYPNSIDFSIECDPALYSAAVVPLMLLNFVENTIKYEVRIGKKLGIHIGISRESERVKALIYDTGGGFSEEALAYLQNLDPTSYSDSTHIGISNVIVRMHHVYPDAVFTFRNREDAGAEILIDFPFVPYPGESVIV